MKKLERDANNASNELNQREALEAKSKQLAQEEQVNLIKFLIQEIATNEKLECKDIHYRILKGKPIHITEAMTEQKKSDKYKRVRIEGKYLIDLLTNNNLLNEDEVSCVERCSFFNDKDGLTYSFFDTCRRKMKKLCKTYAIEYDLLQFKNVKVNNSMHSIGDNDE